MALKFNMIGLFVRDLSRMVPFYRDVLGLAIEWDGKGPYAEFLHEGIRFSMYERARLPELLGQTPGYPAGVNGTFELAVDLPRFEQVDQEFRRLVEAGADAIYEPRDEPWGMRSSMIADPEGNLIEVGSWNRGAAATATESSARELCPRCGCLREMRVSMVSSREASADGLVQQVTTRTVHCAVCNVFVRSEEKRELLARGRERGT